ncbi:MAG TPA: isoprenyl transferase [Bacteroidales bacterium]|nr:MAG: di-trans,poly-cis-decaprenylcistransferase [Bacteroidetes bacterium GWE2_42_24]OFY29443.1 MAG: di-trans,poly-cis-decaprenylcistransferase [Bacteroidetes bacterium GWF2_43_11]HBZ67886.1 isoprenyl transferase [Bacteroidales bacterium]
MIDLKDQIDLKKLPRHVAVIMDGNGRWAAIHGKERVFGHQNGVTSVRETAETAADLGIEYLTLYAFSTENWNRPAVEVEALMSLLVNTIHSEMDTLNKNNIRLNAIGDLDSLKPNTKAELLNAIEQTKNHKRMVMTLALSYSSRWEITNAMRCIAEKVKTGILKTEDITDLTIASHLTTAAMPDPELLIRTSGEFRLSNYLLWQIAYSELYFTPTLWPDFRRNDFYKALIDFQKRERRFGKTSDQIKAELPRP